MRKVSVVVPTYRSGDGLDRLVASLDAQTLQTSEFEVIFVDDGSPDDTFERVQRIAAARENVRYERIENSGWPCRPRNIGTDLAEGEFVAYMDHDDLLYPDALRAAYEFAVATGADVVNGKEARTHDATWAIDTYRADLEQSIGGTDQHPLIPMNPHKLYRRAFLNEHGIRFREGGRVLWEDIFFNLQVARHAAVIATMASTPYYHWYTTPGSGSHGFLRSGQPFWDWMREVLTAIGDELDGDAFGLQRAQLRAHQYRSRILGSFDARFVNRPRADRDLIYDACRGLQTDFGLWEHDDALSRTGAIRAKLLHDDRRTLLEQLPTHDPGLPGRVQVTSARWVEGRLELEGIARWQSAEGRRHALRAQGDALHKVLPAAYDDAVPAELRDVTAEVHAASAEFGIRSAESRITWMLPGEHSTTVTVNDGAAEFEVRVRAVLDPATAVFGRALEPGRWELNGRCTLAQSTQQHRVTGGAATAVLFGDQVRAVVTAGHGNLDVLVGDPGGEVLRSTVPSRAVSAVRGDDAITVSIPLPGVHVERGGAARVAVGVGTDAAGRGSARGFAPRDAEITDRDGAAVLRFDVPPGTARLRLRLGDRVPQGAAFWELDLHRPDAPTLTPRGRAARPQSAAGGFAARARKRVGRLLRRFGLR